MDFYYSIFSLGGFKRWFQIKNTVLLVSNLYQEIKDINSKLQRLTNIFSLSLVPSSVPVTD